MCARSAEWMVTGAIARAGLNYFSWLDLNPSKSDHFDGFDQGYRHSFSPGVQMMFHCEHLNDSAAVLPPGRQSYQIRVTANTVL